jgi:hypothetical protein
MRYLAAVPPAAALPLAAALTLAVVLPAAALPPCAAVTEVDGNTVIRFLYLKFLVSSH